MMYVLPCLWIESSEVASEGTLSYRMGPIC